MCWQSTCSNVIRHPDRRSATQAASFRSTYFVAQAEMTKITSPAQRGVTAGLFQTARFGGAILAGGQVGVAFAGANTDDLRRLCIVIVPLSLMLFIRAAQKVVRPSCEEGFAICPPLQRGDT